MSDNVFISFLEKFDESPFCVRGRDEYRIGEGESEFVVNLKKQISMHSLITSTSLALGEAYMDGELEIEGDLYHALNCFLGQIFQNESAYGPILFPTVNAVDKSG